ncbi:unnamed protein product [Cylicostephanus goldi]|uniref:Malic enzyme n=1 Tax=Cylicostephanus goldi TaxID=71465 RepID=A0A3P6R0R9_CYLGO|nr:unnamed protein product [Cylicostephanus goldi]
MFRIGNNLFFKTLLEDPFYTGLRRKRTRGEAYDTLVDNFLKAVVKRFGRDTLIQFEDFGNANAYRLLDKYKDHYCTFNDDIQGTAAIVLAGLLTTLRVTKKKLAEYKIFFFGAGGANTGVAELCIRQMVDEGISEKEACSNIFLFDIDGLITTSRSDISPRHKRFAKDLPNTKDLLKAIQMAKPQALIGASTKGGAFTREVIEEMAKHSERPVIFALSNPTKNSECTAEEAYKYTDGKVLFASGSPFENVEMNGKVYKPGQGNNAYIFPGVGLGCILFKAKHIPDTIFLLAARKVASLVTEKSLNKYSRIYPRLKNIREISVQIAVEVGNYLYKQDLSSLIPEPDDMVGYVARLEK